MRLSRGFIAFLTGLGLTAASALPLSVAGYLLMPGIIVAMAVGAGTFHEPLLGASGGVWPLAVIYSTSFLVWALVGYAVASILAKRGVA